ncbi:MAG TPA: ABC transporter permease [Candidatus Cybelea sp.]|nr:ABC transporter permease [Candidatus Cybelea sp.]
MSALIQDVRYALRMLAKNPGFTAIAVLTLALGIGANTALFSVVNGVLLNPLPYPHPERLVAVAEQFPPFPEASLAYPNFLDWVRMNRTFEALAAYRHTDFNLTGRGDAQRLSAQEVSASFFRSLGARPVLGRDFSPKDDERGAAPVVILSGGLWKSRFGASPEILGQMLTLDGTGYTVIGVLPENFYFCCESMNFELGDIYVPIGSDTGPWVVQRDFHPGIRAIGRLKPGVTIEQARADMDKIALDLARSYPQTNKDTHVVLAPLRERMVHDIRPTLLVLLASVGFVLLIACSNVANLLLVRAAERAREFAVRSVLGATGRRVTRQVLTESLLLSTAGGGLGLFFASWGTQAGLKLLPEALPRAGDVHMDPRVLLFALVVSTAAGILFGLAPAWKTARSDVHETLKQGGRSGSATRHRTQSILVVVELAMAALLLIGAGLTIRSLQRLWTVNPGFDAQHVLSFDLNLPRATAKETPGQVRAMLEQLPSRVAAIPGVAAASVTDGSEPMNDDWEEPFWIEGKPKPPTLREMPETLFYIVSRDYLRVMKTPLLRGRFFSRQDGALSRRVGVIDETFAREYFPTQDPVGQRIVIEDSPFEIIGVVGHVKQWGLDEDATDSVKIQLYTLAEQIPDPLLPPLVGRAGFVVRTATPNYASADAIRTALRTVNSEQVAYDFKSMDRVLADSLASRAFGMILLGAFAAIALVLATIGIYGVVSHIAGQRTREIGIRLALGAQREDVLRIVMADAARMTFVGVPVGLAAAVLLTGLIKKILFGVSTTDPLTFAAVAVLLSAVTLAACYVPARRAMRVDPIVALREE